MRPPAYSMEGAAELRLQFTGKWAGFVPPQTTGSAWLTDVTTDALGISVPLHISNVKLTLDPSEVRAENVVASLGDAGGARFSGSLSLPRHCAHPQDCVVHFALRSPALDLVEMKQILGPAALT